MNYLQIIAIISVFAGTRDEFRKISYSDIHPIADASGAVNEKAVADEATESADTFWNATEGALMQAAMCALPELNQLYVELEIFGYRKRIEFNFTFFENVLFEKWTPEFESLVKQAAEHFKEDLTKELITLYKETYSKILHI